MSNSEWVALGVGVLIGVFSVVYEAISKRAGEVPLQTIRKWGSCLLAVVGMGALTVLIFYRNSPAGNFSHLVLYGFAGLGFVLWPVSAGLWLMNRVHRK